MTVRTQVIVSFVHMHAHIQVLPESISDTLLGTWFGVAFIPSTSQKIALYFVSGITLGAMVHEESERKSLFSWSRLSTGEIDSKQIHTYCAVL